MKWSEKERVKKRQRDGMWEIEMYIYIDRYIKGGKREKRERKYLWKTEIYSTVDVFATTWNQTHNRLKVLWMRYK